MEGNLESLQDTAAWQRASDHAWRYFELHAGQRMIMFNFFTVLAGLVAAGLAATMQGPSGLSVLGVLLGILLVLLSFVFWKLDQRAAFLVKHAEEAHKEIESRLMPVAGRLFTSEPHARKIRSEGKTFTAIWTFGRSLRAAFVAMTLVGAIASSISAFRASGIMRWETGDHQKRNEESSSMQIAPESQRDMAPPPSQSITPGTKVNRSKEGR